MSAQILLFTGMRHVRHIEQPARHNEAKQGAGWPLPRGEMISPAAIRARMAEDMGAALARGATCVTTEHLLRLGWHRAQCLQHMRATTHMIAGLAPCGSGPALPGGDCA